MKLGIALHEAKDGQYIPFVAPVQNEADGAAITLACTLFGIEAWEIWDGQKIGNYVVRLEKAPEGAP
jgi:hypothetical protein